MKALHTAALLAAAGNFAVAHDGHGAAGAHWHASDAWGFVALAVAAALYIWFRRGR